MEDGCVPLIYPAHFSNGAIAWPKSSARKPNAILNVQATARSLVPDGNYVLVKRFTAKEERRRIVAVTLQSKSLGSERIGLENHLNYFHQDGNGLPLEVARGLSLFLNSSAVDAYFRRFSGHTQVNATDLRNMRYPSRESLGKAGRRVGAKDFGDQSWIDQLTAAYFG
jgi:adenine-specific DNA-methyltransferase